MLEKDPETAGNWSGTGMNSATAIYERLGIAPLFAPVRYSLRDYGASFTHCGHCDTRLIRDENPE